MGKDKIFDVGVIVIEKDKIKIPKTILGVTYITRGTLNAKDLDSNAKKLILKHELYHQISHRKKTFTVVSGSEFIVSYLFIYLMVQDILISLISSILISVFTFLLLFFSVGYENEIEADLFAAKELGKDKAIAAIKTIQNSELGRKMEHGSSSPFHKLEHPTLEQRLILFKEN